jgi:NitT/TauT family transport system permease protein
MQKTTFLTKENRLTALYFVLIMVTLIGGWEGVKYVGKATDYSLELGPITIGLGKTRNLTMPHIADIFRALNKPSQRNGPPLIEQLAEASWFTFREAFIGFTLGTSLGLLLAIIFAHSRILQKGLMPYVVASQTVPILALAPKVVIWSEKLGFREMGVPLIAAYLAFFPVVIYALRGLSDVPETALELMQSYAAGSWLTLWKLRMQNAMPYIFTALKITAPASVVGAVIGELPSGIQDGLGGQIISFAQYYTSGPARLWATNLITALLGISFFVAVAVAERFVVRWKYSDTFFNQWVVNPLWRYRYVILFVIFCLIVFLYYDLLVQLLDLGLTL